jgi:protein SCO1/2
MIVRKRGPLLALCLALALGALAPQGAAAASGGAQPAGGVEVRLGTRLPLGVHFRSSEGREVALADALGGKPALLVLAYNRCTMLCSLVLRSVATLMRGFDLRPGEQFTLVTLSIDPRDTVFEASRLQASLVDAAGFPGEPGRWTFLVGEKPAIDSVADAVGFRYAWDPETEQYNHPAVLFTLSPDGRVSGYFDGVAPDRAAVKAALVGAGPITGAASAGLGVILDCFRFDAARTRYGSAIAWFLRAGAASVGLGLCALLWRVARTRPRGAGGSS